MTFCLPGPPDFAALDAKATAMKLAVRKDVANAAAARAICSFEILAGARSRAASMNLSPAKARGPNGEVASCGIGADDVDGEEMKQDLINTMKLGRAGIAKRAIRPTARSA